MEVRQFIESFQNAFIPLVLGVSDEDDFINSKDTANVMDQIQEKYLTDSTVTIVLVGKCTRRSATTRRTAGADLWQSHSPRQPTTKEGACHPG